MILNWLGVLIGVGSVLLGAVLEGLQMTALSQPTAALIVGGGTLGATMLASGPVEFMGAIKATSKLFFKAGHDHHALTKQLVEMATAARREGLLALEKFVPQIQNPFLANNLRHIVDGYDATVLREMMEERIHQEAKLRNGVGKIYETAGGFSPTIGIIGAVLGLIHVMGNLSDSSKLGEGIGVAFVATLYGVGLANLLFIPIGNKLKRIGADEIHEYELVMSGLLGIQAGMNPRVIEDRLLNLSMEYASDEAPGEKKAA